MKTFEVTYTVNRETFHTLTIEGETLTMALVNFVVKYPDYEYTDAREISTQERLFTENQKLVYHIVHKHFSSLEEAYGEDMVSEGNLALWLACKKYDPSRNVRFDTYAYHVIKNRLTNYIKRHIVKHSHVVSLETVIADDGEGGELHIKDTLKIDNTELTIRQNIQDCLVQLSELEQAIIHKLMNGYTQDDIAKEHHISQPTVSRCLNKFKRLYLKELK